MDWPRHSVRLCEHGEFGVPEMRGRGVFGYTQRKVRGSALSNWAEATGCIVYFPAAGVKIYMTAGCA